MSKKQILGAFIAAFLFIIIGFSNVLTNSFVNYIFESLSSKTIEHDSTIPSKEYIGVVSVKGTILEDTNEGNLFANGNSYKHNETMNYIDELINDTNNAGLILYVDSPGGAVYESEELYHKLKEYKEVTGREIWTYMSHYAASGGYMISALSDKIIANVNTITGSIGVIMSGLDLTGLYDKLGIKEVNITTGSNKAGGFSEEQIAIYQSQADEVHQRFLNIVSQERNIDIEILKPLADGRTYTATQALNHGLIDEINSYEKMKEDFKEYLAVDLVYEKEFNVNNFEMFFSKLDSILPKSDSQVLAQLAKNDNKGLWFYYAE